MLKNSVPQGCITALVTPFNSDGSIDWSGMRENIEFQILQGAKGVVPVGTTGESPTLDRAEHCMVLVKTADHPREDTFILSGCGSNSTKEALYYMDVAWGADCGGGLFVDPYYNGPSSLEIRENYYSLLARRFPTMAIVPYVIPGRTGCELSAVDLAILAWRFPNLQAVKEATGNLDRMRETRKLAPPDFKIISGDDDMTFAMMTDPEISASGVISVISNIAPAAVQRMCQSILDRNWGEAEKIKLALDPLFKLVTIRQSREIVLGLMGKQESHVVTDRFRNPVGIKTMMQGLGMPAGPCRPPLGKMTRNGVQQVRDALKEVWGKNPWVLEPIESFYKVSIPNRLADDEIWNRLSFEGGN